MIRPLFSRLKTGLVLGPGQAVLGPGPVLRPGAWSLGQGPVLARTGARGLEPREHTMRAPFELCAHTELARHQ